MNTKIIFAVTFIVLSMIGCSKESTSPTGSTQTANFTVSPKDGATGVRLDDAIILNFAKSVNRAVVEKNLHLISEFAMRDSLCPVSNLMGHGMMNNAMIDSMKMNHLMVQHRTLGKFQWNGDSTQCAFKPDSMMLPNMNYMIHMGSEMMKMMENRIGNMDMMGNHGAGMMTNDMFYHFTTMDTASVGSGHDSHHR